MKYYTKTGDGGQTSLYTGERVDKDSLRVEAYGTVDELQAFMGLARCSGVSEEVADDIEAVECDLVHVMAQLASTDGKERITDENVGEIEAMIDKYTDRIDTKGFKFEVPGTSSQSAALHVTRTVARRAERRVLEFSHSEEVLPALKKYLNRISDLLYAMALYSDLDVD